MKKLCFLIYLILTVFCNISYAQDTDSNALSRETINGGIHAEPAYLFPVIKPDVYLTVGYRFVNLKGSESAGEFEYLRDSFVLGSELRVFSYPHRLHLDLDISNRKDYFADLTYAYRDIFYVRGINRTLFHNLENISLTDIDASSSSPGVDIRDAGEKYGVRAGMTDILVRFKMPDFPFHVYIDGSIREQDGTRQQRSLLGSGYFNDNVRVSQARDVDWTSGNFVFGVNSHLGPVEVDISHGEKRFDVNERNAFIDDYSGAGFPQGSLRNAGAFMHNLTPELESSTNSLKFHTSYTGRIVASATFTKTDTDNRDSRAGAEYFIGTGEVIWTASPKLLLFLRYKYRDTDIDNSDTAFIEKYCASSNNLTGNYRCTVKPSLSNTTDTVSAMVRYRPLSRLSLRGKFTHQDISRENAGQWNLPDSTSKDTASLSADLRITRTLKLKAKYIHRDTDNPAYNTEPDTSDRAAVSVSWIPAPRLNAFISYNITDESRDNLFFKDGVTADSRSVKQKMFLGNLTCLILEDISVTAAYAYMMNRTAQDIAYSDISGMPAFDSSVPYRDKAHSYLLDISYMPRDYVTLDAGASRTVSRGGFSPDNADLNEPVSISEFSGMKTEETIYSLSGKFTFKNGFISDLQYRYKKFDDCLDNPYDDVEDGRAHVITLTITKRW